MGGEDYVSSLLTQSYVPDPLVLSADHVDALNMTRKMLYQNSSARAGRPPLRRPQRDDVSDKGTVARRRIYMRGTTNRRDPVKTRHQHDLPATG